MRTSRVNGYIDRGAELCQEFSCQTSSKFDEKAAALIDSLCDNPGRLPGGGIVTFGTVRHYVKLDCVRRFLVLLPEAERVSVEVRSGVFI